ncbi:uncharacterized protein FFE2_16079 [Fusarium fujikuroi]|nr:uncharacterized protein FFE2_16079 [Fusarium fujikuroi]
MPFYYKMPALVPI